MAELSQPQSTTICHSRRFIAPALSFHNCLSGWFVQGALQLMGFGKSISKSPDQLPQIPIESLQILHSIFAEPPRCTSQEAFGPL